MAPGSALSLCCLLPMAIWGCRLGATGLMLSVAFFAAPAQKLVWRRTHLVAEGFMLVWWAGACSHD